MPTCILKDQLKKKKKHNEAWSACLLQADWCSFSTNTSNTMWQEFWLLQKLLHQSSQAKHGHALLNSIRHTNTSPWLCSIRILMSSREMIEHYPPKATGHQDLPLMLQLQWNMHISTWKTWERLLKLMCVVINTHPATWYLQEKGECHTILPSFKVALHLS